jgi:hypothetical protein
MAEVAACLKLDVNTPIPMLKTIPIQLENQDPAANHAVSKLTQPGVSVGQLFIMNSSDIQHRGEYFGGP